MLLQSWLSYPSSVGQLQAHKLREEGLSGVLHYDPPGQEILRLLDTVLKNDRELFHTESLFQTKLLSEVIHFSVYTNTFLFFFEEDRLNNKNSLEQGIVMENYPKLSLPQQPFTY